MRWAVAAALVLVAGQACLVLMAPSMTHAAMEDVADVLPFVLALAISGAVGLAASPKLADVATSTIALGAMIAVGLAMRLAWFGAPAPLDDDFYRYLWDGGVVSAGFSPYRFAPDAVIGGGGQGSVLGTLATQAGGILAHINFPDLTSIYPATAQFAFAVAHWIKPWSIDGLRVAFLAADAAMLLLTMAALKRLGRSPLFAALYWCNPLVVLSTLGAGHVDALLPPLVLGALMAVQSGRRVPAAMLLAAATGVKIWPILLAPLLLRDDLRNPRRLLVPALVLMALSILLLAPVVMNAGSPNSGLRAYSQGWSNNNGPFAWASYGLYAILGESPAAQSGLRALVALGALGIAILAAAPAITSFRDRLTRALVVSAAVFYLAPAQFPWYALGFLGLAATLQCWPLLLASVTLPAYYLFFPLWQSDDADLFLYGAAFIHVVPVWAWLAWTAWQRHSRSPAATSECAP